MFSVVDGAELNIRKKKYIIDMIFIYLLVSLLET